MKTRTDAHKGKVLIVDLNIVRKRKLVTDGQVSIDNSYWFVYIDVYKLPRK